MDKATGHRHPESKKSPRIQTYSNYTVNGLNL